MKNILLLGVPRSGKSTFAKMILKEYPNFNLIQEDVITSAYIETTRKINYQRNKNDKSESVDIKLDQEFIYKMIKQVFDYSVEFEPSLNFVLDAMSIELEEACKYDKNKFIVLFFGYPNISLENALDNILKYDKKDDWTYIEPRWRIKEFLEVYIEDSKDFEEKCKKLNIKFVDTSTNREQVLEDLFKWLKKEIN